MKNDTRGNDNGGGQGKVEGQSTGLGHKAPKQSVSQGSYSPASYGNVSAGQPVKLKTDIGTKRQGPSTLEGMV